MSISIVADAEILCTFNIFIMKRFHQIIIRMIEMANINSNCYLDDHLRRASKFRPLTSYIDSYVATHETAIN